MDRREHVNCDLCAAHTQTKTQSNKQREEKEIRRKTNKNIVKQTKRRERDKGTFQKRFSGFCPLRGGGVPPLSAKEKILLFFTLTPLTDKIR